MRRWLLMNSALVQTRPLAGGYDYSNYQVHVNISILFNEIPVYDQPNLLSQRKPAMLFPHT